MFNIKFYYVLYGQYTQECFYIRLSNASDTFGDSASLLPGILGKLTGNVTYSYSSIICWLVDATYVNGRNNSNIYFKFKFNMKFVGRRVFLKIGYKQW